MYFYRYYQTSISDWMSNARVEFSRDHAHDHTSSSLPKAKRRKPARTASRNDSVPGMYVNIGICEYQFVVIRVFSLLHSSQCGCGPSVGDQVHTKYCGIQCFFVYEL